MRVIFNEFPVGILLLAGLALFGAVLEVLALIALAIFFGPCHSLGIFLVVIDAFFHAAEQLGFVNAFIAHSEVFLEEVGVNDRTGYTHAHGAD